MGARLAIVCGETELAAEKVQVKDLDAREQADIPFTDVARYVSARLSTEATGSAKKAEA
jgi:histidyl-tRNA synthetase